MVDPIILASPYVDSVSSGVTKFYYVDVPMPFTGLHIEAVSMYGNAAIFVNVAGQNGVGAVPSTSYPSATSATYFSSTFAGAAIGTDAVDIYPTDAAVRNVCVRGTRVSSVCTFMIAVTAAAPASFTLYAGVDSKF